MATGTEGIVKYENLEQSIRQGMKEWENALTILIERLAAAQQNQGQQPNTQARPVQPMEVKSKPLKKPKPSTLSTESQSDESLSTTDTMMDNPPILNLPGGQRQSSQSNVSPSKAKPLVELPASEPQTSTAWVKREF